jgi:ABC-type antimicrobial peptide transport system permease subunit
MRAAIAELDPLLSLFNTRTVDALHAQALSVPRMVAALTGSFALFALALGVIGVHGLVAFSVATRRRETGVRLALGASRTDVARLFLGQGLGLVGIGLAIGVAGAMGAGVALGSVSPDIPSFDAASLMLAAALLAGATLAACMAPIRRAAVVDPTEIMRTDE